MEGYRDSLGILSLQNKAITGGILLDAASGSPDELRYQDSLGILGQVGSRVQSGHSQVIQSRELDLPSQQLSDSLGILSPQRPQEQARSTAEQEINKRLSTLTKSKWIESQREMGVPDEAIEKELGGVQHPWVDPLEVGAAGWGFGAKFALSKGAKLGSAALRGLATGAPGVAMEYPLGTFIDSFAEGNEELALLAAIGLGLLSGMTVETLAERKLLTVAQNIARKHPEKAAKVLPKEVLERFKAKPTEAGELAATAPVEAPQNVLDVEQARLERRRAQAAARMQAPVEPEPMPFTRSGGIVEDVVTTPAIEGKGYKDSINILNPPDTRKLLAPETVESARGAAVVAAREAAEKRAAQAVEAPNFRSWVALSGGVNPKDPTWGGELRGLTRGVGRGGKTVSKVPPGFYNVEARGLDERVTDAIDAGWLRRGANDQDFFDLLETNPTKRLAQLDELDEGEAAKGMEDYYRSLRLHPSTVTGPLGGIAAGVDWEALKEGDIKVDPKKALYGALAGAAGGAALPKARQFAHTIANKWETKFAEPFLDKAKDTVNNYIVNENMRTWLGMGRSKVYYTAMREFKRDTETLWSNAVDIGKELQKLAPTAVEQKRLMQVMKGSITGNAEMQAKARQVQGLFHELRENLKSHDLLQYSRFDKLTRAERAKLRKIISLPDPATLNDANQLNAMAHNLGLQPPQGFYRQEDFIKDAQAELKFYRDRLNDYYHFASAKEYAPIYYSRHEGLTPQQRQVLMDEINTLKIRSRRGNPEGQQEMEALISQLEKLLGSGTDARKQARAAYRGLVKGYAHQRQEIPIEVQRIMGLIEEAPFPVAKGMGVQQTDIRKARLFEYISDQPGWSIRPRKNVDVPANYHLVEDERFGVLNGQYVRKDIWSDLKEVEEWRSAFVAQWDKYLGWWKYGKVVLNPATHFRNTYSNLMLAYLGDVSPTDIKTYAAAAKALKQGMNNEHYARAKNWGLFNTTFYSAEISKLRDELEAVRNPGQIKNFIRNLMSAPADLYQGNEKLFKLAVFIKARAGGASVDEAARKAEKFLFNYGDIPPMIKGMKRWVAPFATFTYKALPLFAEMAIKKPWKVGAIMASMYAMEEYSKHKLGLSDDEAAEERRLLPEWQRKRIGPYVHVLMPFRDKWGSNLYMDFSYILPYGTVAEKWGQSAIPLDDILLSNPLFQISAAIMTNTDPFTGREIYNDVLDSTARITAKYLEYAWRDIAPSMAPGGYSWNKLKTGLMNTFTDKKVLDWAGRPLELETAIFSSLFGIKLSPADTRKLKEFQIMELRKIDRAVSTEIQKLKREKDRNIITQEEFREEMDKLIDLKKKLITEKR
jgi:hypothetical protein